MGALLYLFHMPVGDGVVLAVRYVVKGPSVLFPLVPADSCPLGRLYGLGPLLLISTCR
jgi:hypothetical protein